MMNDQSTELAIMGDLIPDRIFSHDGIDGIIARIRAEVMSEVVDISTPAGRKRCASLAYKVARSKTLLDDIGKKLVEDAKEQVKVVDRERKKLRDELDALRDEVRMPLTEWENAEKARVAAHEKAILEITQTPEYYATASAASISARIDALMSYPDRDWQEFFQRAHRTLEAEISTAKRHLSAAEDRERAAAETERLKKEAAERERADRELAIAAEARKKAERQAAAALEAAATEKRQIEAEAAAAIARAERERKAALDVASRAEIARDAAERRAIAERIAAGEAAEHARIEAVHCEQRRIAALKKADDNERSRREADADHKKGIHREILSALCSNGINSRIAREIVIMIVRKEIPHVSIMY